MPDRPLLLTNIGQLLTLAGRRFRVEGKLCASSASWKTPRSCAPAGALSRPDAPLTPESAQTAIHHIMGRFYRLRHMFSIWFHTMSFPSFLFYAHGFKPMRKSACSRAWDRTGISGSSQTRSARRRVRTRSC